MKTIPKFLIVIITLFLLLPYFSRAQVKLDSILPVRGLCIAAPRPAGIDAFTKFISDELATRNVNTLILRIDWNYQFTTHPELRDSVSLSEADVKKIVSVCRKNNIRLIPQINLLGHQSWASTTHNLLKVYPHFDETPHVKMPEKFAWPNPDGLYCKSYCPLHPEVHKIVFNLVKEICDVFEADAFPWRNPALAVKQVNDMVNFRSDATPVMKDRFQGMVQTVWSGAESFIKECQEAKEGKKKEGLSQWNCFDKMFEKINEIAK